MLVAPSGLSTPVPCDPQVSLSTTSADAVAPPISHVPGAAPAAADATPQAPPYQYVMHLGEGTFGGALERSAMPSDSPQSGRASHSVVSASCASSERQGSTMKQENHSANASVLARAARTCAQSWNDGRNP